MLAAIVLYHGLAQTSLVEWSGTSSTGPWTEHWLPATVPIVQASYTFSDGGMFCEEGRIPTIEAGSGTYWLRAHPTLWELWGFGAEADVDGVIEVTGLMEGSNPLGIVTRQEHGVEIGTSFPLDVESVDTAEYRAGRVSAVRYGRVIELEVTFLVPADIWDAYEDSPILMGHCAMWVQKRIGDDTPRSESELDGAFTCYPIATEEVLNESPEDVVVVRLRATMEDPE